MNKSVFKVVRLHKKYTYINFKDDFSGLDLHYVTNDNRQYHIAGIVGGHYIWQYRQKLCL